MNTVELASRILTQLGFYQEPSKEIGIDDRRDNIVHLIEEYTHPAKTLTEIEILKTCYECGITRNEMISGLIDDDYMITFARAILKKANEK